MLKSDKTLPKVVVVALLPIKLNIIVGSIKIELEPSKRCKNGWVSKPVEYTIGYGDGIGYWLRRQNRCGHTFPLHYNRKTGEYGFETFEDAANHLEKLFIKKYL